MANLMENEGFFKGIFFFAIFFLFLIVIGVFLVILKILLLFYPELHIMGLTILK
ncbi:MAG: hypothetical protein MUF50_02055 [Planctomycetes bacterium]|jgi:hypothetical protein|nr:hypothetical protein [Planctomycetota bacterium]